MNGGLNGMTLAQRATLLAAIVDDAVTAGGVIWDHFRAGCAVEAKDDLSPVTAADRDAEAVILTGLARAAPGVPVVAEEEAAAGRIPTIEGAFFLVDPLDGTKEFIRHGTDFTVNIALIEHGAPTMGVVYAPARDTLFWGDVTSGAWCAAQPPHGTRAAARTIRVRAVGDRLCATASKSHATPATAAWLEAAGAVGCVAVGSSLKFAMIASGQADVYPRAGPTMEWDTAAGDAVLRAAGGRTLDPDGALLTYGKPGFFNPGFVATGPYQPAPLRGFL